MPITADVYFLRTVYTANAAGAALARILPVALRGKSVECANMRAEERYFGSFGPAAARCRPGISDPDVGS